MTVTDNGGACSHADFSSCWGCGRQIVACCDSVAEQWEKAEGGEAVLDRSRSAHAVRSVKTDWLLQRRLNCRSAERSRWATSSRPPSPERRRTAITSPSSVHFPSVRRRFASAVYRTQPRAVGPEFCNTRCLSPWSSRFALQSCAGSEGGCRYRYSFQIPERFPNCASIGNWQVPSARAGSKQSWDPLDSS